jgi:hypothetical protein
MDVEATGDITENCHCGDNQKYFLERAFDNLELNDSQRSLLLNSFREVTVQIPLRVERSGGTMLETFDGFRVQHN